jgi:hypothetical protein
VEKDKEILNQQLNSSMETTQAKDQFVIAYLTSLNKTQAIIANAVAFSRMLDKGLILLYICDKAYTNVSTQEAEKQLIELNKNIDLAFHSYCAIEGKTKDIIHSLGEALNAVLLVTAADLQATNNKYLPACAEEPKTLLANLYTSRIAYFITSIENVEQVSFQHVVLTVEQFRESKEKVLWASYFGRFAHSKVTVYYHNYRDEFFRQQLHYNLKFTKKIFDEFALNYELFFSKDSKTFVDWQALTWAKEQKASFVICQTTKEKKWYSKYFGLNEHKTLCNPQGLPVLFVNLRDDLFVLCD